MVSKYFNHLDKPQIPFAIPLVELSLMQEKCQLAAFWWIDQLSAFLLWTGFLINDKAFSEPATSAFKTVQGLHGTVFWASVGCKDSTIHSTMEISCISEMHHVPTRCCINHKNRHIERGETKNLWRRNFWFRSQMKASELDSTEIAPKEPATRKKLLAPQKVCTLHHTKRITK